MNTLITTLPKTGTHLLRQIVGPHHWLPGIKNFTYISMLKDCGVILPPNKKHESGADLNKFMERIAKNKHVIACGHLPYIPPVVDILITTEVKIIQLIRDPRDTVVSHFHSVIRRDRPQNYFDFYFDDGLRLSEKDDPLLWAIKCAPYWWAGWTPWIENNTPNMIVRFEDLVGSNGQQTIEMIADLIGEDSSVDDIIKRIDPTKSMTFRKGLVGEWKKEFQQHHIEYFNSVMQPTMEVLGYA